MRRKAISVVVLTLLLTSMLTFAPSIPSATATKEKNPAEFLRMATTENITVLENGTAHLAILINIPSSPLAEMYRKLLAAPPDADVEEEMPIPENTMRKTHSGENATETPISVKEKFYKSIEEQQKFSLGFIIEIFDSKMVPRSSSNGCKVSLSACTSLPIVDITQINSHCKWEIAIGPKNAVGDTTGSIFNQIELVQLMLESLPGEQFYESFWSTRIELPANAKLLNRDEIDGLSWKIDFGGGTYINALVSLNGTSTIVLDERTVVTEQKNAATPTHLYEAFSHYKTFNIEYLLPHSSSTFYENKKYTEQKGALTESGDTWSYTWTESWSDSISQPFTYGPLDALLTVTASITFSGYVGWDFDLFEGLTKFESWMQLDTSVEMDLEVTATVDYDHTWDEPLFEWSTTFYFAYFVLPVWADLHITATGVLSVDAYGQLTVTAGVSASASFTAGVRWTNTGGWEGIYDVSTSTSYYGPTIEAEAGIWAKPSVRFRIAFLFYGVAGPYIEFEPYAILTLTCSYPPPHGEWSLAVHLKITAGATFAGWLKDILGLDDWSIILTQPDILIMSWSGSWGPSSMSITETLDPSTTLTSSQVHVYGTATFNDGDAVSHADVIVAITQTGASWTTTTGSNGDYSAYISAPESAGSYTVEASVSTGALSDSTSRTLTVEDITDPGTNYQLYRTTTCKDVQPVSPWDPITETSVFRTSDPTAYTWVHLIDVYIGLNYKFEWYDPDDNFYWSYEDSTDPPPPGQYWSWYKFYAGIYISGYMPQDMEGRWRCKVHIDEGGGYELVAIEEFVIRYEIFSAYRTMAKDVLGGVDNPTEPYDPIDPTNKFLNTDPRALGWIRLDELAEAVEVKWEWRDPSGNIDFTWNYISDDPADEGALYYTWYKFWGWIDIYGTSRQSKIGTWELRAYIKDVYGNWDLEYSEYFTISDNTPPGTPGTPVDDGDYSTTGDVTWAWTEASEDWFIAEYQIQVGTSPNGNDVFDGYVGTDLTITLTGLPSGSTYYARVRAVNTVGQWGPWSGVSDGITVDRPPMTLIVESPGEAIDYNDITFVWSGSDDVTPTLSLDYSCFLEGYDSGWSSWTSSTSKQYNNLPYSEYTFKVKARDQLGNVDPTPANTSFTIAPFLVRNVDTNLNYTTIQAAIDAPETSDKHTIIADAGTYYENVVVNKTVSLIGEDIDGTVIDGTGLGNVVEITADNVAISGFTVRNGDNGIFLIGSSNNNISGNNITGATGIYIHNSYCYISENNINNGDTGIVVEGPEGWAYITGNSITENTNLGIEVWFDAGVTILGNNVSANGVGIDIGSFGTISGNLITNNNGDGIHVGHATANIYENTITGNGNGIYVSGDSDGYVTGNAILNNHEAGVKISMSSIQLCSNTIAGNGYGVHFVPPSMFVYSSTIYHNNFTDNTAQVHIGDYVNVWDDGYPSGGNYWSDYQGEDFYRGPYQNETGSDGIGDTPYVIDANNTDYYPLMKPYGGPYDIGILSMNSSKTVVGQGYDLTITVKVVNYGIGDQTFNVTLYANTTNIQTQTITLTNRNSITITVTWNTTDIAYGKYTISAVADIVSGETDTADNTLDNGVVMVTIPGDVNGDTVVDILDAGEICGHWYPGPPIGSLGYGSNADINSDGEVDILDAAIISAHWLQSYPATVLSVEPPTIIDETLTPQPATTLRPTADGAYTGWTGDHADWDETVQNGDTDYVSATASGLLESSALEDPAHPSWDIANVRVVAYARTNVTTDEELVFMVVIGGVEYYSNYPAWPKAGYVLTTSYAEYSWEWGKNPATGDYWTWSDIDNLEAGVESKVGADYVWTGEMRVTQLYVEVEGPRLTVDIDVSNVEDLWAYWIVLDYDTTILTATSYTSYAPYTYAWPSEINDTAGYVSVSYSKPPGEPGESGNMLLVEIAFLVEGLGETDLDLHDTILANSIPEWVSHEVDDGYFANCAPAMGKKQICTWIDIEKRCLNVKTISEKEALKRGWQKRKRRVHGAG